MLKIKREKERKNKHIEQADYSHAVGEYENILADDMATTVAPPPMLDVVDNDVYINSSTALEIQTDDNAIIISQDNEKYQLKIAEGLIIDIRTADSNYLDDVLEMRQSYLGVKPRKAGDFVGRWITCLGCMVIPMERSKEVIDKETGEVIQKKLRWNAVLFKLDKIDDETGMNVIMSGGGQSVMELAMLYAIRGKIGDWDAPREIFVSQEERQISKQQWDGLSKEVRELTSPGRMYRIVDRRIQKREGE